MYCPRLDHFVRLNPTGTVGCCGHMTTSPQFENLEVMHSSEWMTNIKHQFENNVWPSECLRCQQTESINQTSIRLNAIEFDKKQTIDNYLTVGGVLDNICNSACQFCNQNLSTKIGSLITKKYIKIDNLNKFQSLPQERIVHLDINGGEPSASKNYQYLLNNLPPNVKSIRVNTNCSTVIKELEEINKRGIEVTVTVSFDGIGPYHDYVRWPISWDKFHVNLSQYQQMNLHDLNLWTTVNALNINDLPRMIEFVKARGLNHSYALLQQPSPLNVRYTNGLTTKAKGKLIEHPIAKFIAIDRDNSDELENYIRDQDAMRGISLEKQYQPVYNGE